MTRLITITALLLAMAACSTLLSEEDYATYQEQVAELEAAKADYEDALSTISELQDEIATLREELAKPDVDPNVVNTAITKLSADLADAMVKASQATTTMEQAAAVIKDLEESNQTPDWALITEAVLASLFGIRVMRGPVSKGPFAKMPLIGLGERKDKPA